MHKVLIISYYWPPAGGPGSLRMVKWAQYLPAYGIQPVVLTVKNGEFPYHDPSLIVKENIPVYRSRSMDPFVLYKIFTGREKQDSLDIGMLTRENKSWREQLAAFIRINFFIPDARIGWSLFPLWRALRIMKREKISCILSSSPPHSSQLIGLLLKIITKKPWIVDLRDPWTDIKYYQVARRSRLANAMDRGLERLVLKHADHIVTVSQPLVHLFRKKVPGKELPLTIIPNGYDDQDFPRMRKTGKKFFILHAGNMVDQQNPLVLWHSLRMLAATIRDFERNVRIRLIGRVAPAIVQELEKMQLTDLCDILPFLPHRTIIDEMTDAALLLVVIPQVDNNNGIVTGKLFEYIGSARPVLVIGPASGEAAQVVAGISNCQACDYEDAETCSGFIRKNYLLWQHKKLPHSTLGQRQPYSRSLQVKKLAVIIAEHS